MRFAARILALFLAAGLLDCAHSATAPKGPDPTVLMTNQSGGPVAFQWWDGQGVTGSDSVPTGVTRCERFTARPDSAYFQLIATNPTSGAQTIYTAPWFDPAGGPAWTADVTSAGPYSAPSVLVKPVAAAC